MTSPLQSRLSEVERQALAHAVHETYMEIFPSPSIERRLGVLEPGSYVAVTCSPARGVDVTLEMCEHLIKRGFRVVPHIAAKMVRNHAHLQEIMRRIGDLGVESIFVPGGDAPHPLGQYSNALQLLRDIAGFDHRLKHIGVAAHPEGHPAIDAESLLRELAAKQPFATYLVTQMCFDATALAAWLSMVRGHGITMPAWIGLPGVFDRAALLAASLRIGVGASLRLLRDRSQLVRRLLGPRIYRPDKFLNEFAPTLAKPEFGIAGFHLFCFNRVEQSEAWRRRFVADLRRSG
jgi:methylenetetrahydrofolate reductase (NADPH)